MYKNLDDYVYSKLGMTIKDVINGDEAPKTYNVRHLPEISAAIGYALSEGHKIAIVGDYDTDGIMSLTIMFNYIYKAAESLKVTPKLNLCIPRRMSDGYGLSESIVERIDTDTKLLITIDNGITANIAIDRIKEELGTKVIIMDHHMQNGELPNADIILDPETIPDDADYRGYCGAGLAYKLCEYSFPTDNFFLEQMSSYAAIATVGDIVELKGDNRRIVRKGLKVINEGKSISKGLKTLLEVLKKNNVSYVDEETISFQIAPMINAPGRLEDRGGEKVLRQMLMGDINSAEEIYNINEQRKLLLNEAIESHSPTGTLIRVMYAEDIPEGLCGIIASKLQEESHCPAFVMTINKKIPGTYKGSCRGSKTNNVFKMLCNLSSEILYSFGGHEEAAGFVVYEDKIPYFIEELEKIAIAETSDGIIADVHISEQDFSSNYLNIKFLKPFGVGFEAPVFEFNTNISGADLIGKEKTTVKVKKDSFDMIGFHLKEDLEQTANKENASVIGRITTNYYNGRQIPQFVIEKIR